MARRNAAGYWADIERWLAAHVPEAIPLLPAGAAARALDGAEETLGYPLPRDVREFLSVHDGGGNLWLHDRGEFMSLGTILSSCNNDEWARPNGPIRKKWFTRKWLPVLDARTGDYVCIDLDPPRGGKRGQLITWSHDGGPAEVIAPSLPALLDAFVTELVAGRYTPKLDQAGQTYLEYREASS